MWWAVIPFTPSKAGTVVNPSLLGHPRFGGRQWTDILVDTMYTFSSPVAQLSYYKTNIVRNYMLNIIVLSKHCWKPLGFLPISIFLLKTTNIVVCPPLPPFLSKPDAQNGVTFYQILCGLPELLGAEENLLLWMCGLRYCTVLKKITGISIKLTE